MLKTLKSSKFRLISLHRLMAVLALISGPSISVPGGAQELVSLNSSIQTAFQKNESTQANVYRLQAQIKNIESSEKSRLYPSFNLSQTFSSSTYVDSQTPFARTRQSYMPITATINLFRGFADARRTVYERCQYRQQEAAYNSTDALIKNTKSQIAGLVTTAFVEVAGSRQNIEFAKENLKMMQRLAPLAKTEVEKARVQNGIASLQIALEEFSTAQTIGENSYAFAVNAPAPAAMETLEQTIASIVVPRTVTEALEYADQKSPDIIAARFGVECQEKRLQAVRAENRGISVDLAVSVGRQANRITGQLDSVAKSSSVQLTFSKTLGFGKDESEESESLAILSAQRYLTSMTQEVEKNTKNYYLNYENGMRAFESYSSNFLRTRTQLYNLIVEFERTQQGDLQGILNLVGNYYGYWDNRDAKMRELITLKFSIQKSIGTLFGSLSTTRDSKPVLEKVN